MKGIVLHSIRDAEHCVGNKLHVGNLLFSTHTSVDVYLKEFYNLNCQCLSQFLDIERVRDYNGNVIADTVDKVLHALDDALAPSLNDRLGLKMRYFTPLYSLIAKYHFLGYLCLVEALKKIISAYKINKLFIYNYKFNSISNLSDVSTDMNLFTSLFFNNIETCVIDYKAEVYKLEKIVETLKKIKRRPLYVLRKAIDKIEKSLRYRKFSDNKKTILLSGHLLDLDFLKRNLNDYNILYYEPGKNSPVGFKFEKLIPAINIDFHNFDFIENREAPLIKIFLKDIKEDFSANIEEYMNAIVFLRKINEKYPISLGIWGDPPSSKLSALVFEYLKSEGIPVLGAQHGNLYGEIYNPWIFDYDFSRCDYLVSYGFTKEDMNRIYPTVNINTKIFPYGRARTISNNNIKKKNIDILFPLTDSNSIFNGGMRRTFPHKLTEIQIKILEYLDSLNGFDIYIKPFAFSTYENCSVLPVLKRLRNLKVINNMTLLDFLNKYNPKTVIIEHPSTPLIDVIHLDAEIFLLDNEIMPYDKKVLEELQKRVHYSENVEELISKINLFLEGKLEKKRDDTYYNHYVYKENTRENILKLIDNLVENNHPV